MGWNLLALMSWRGAAAFNTVSLSAQARWTEKGTCSLTPDLTSQCLCSGRGWSLEASAGEPKLQSTYLTRVEMWSACASQNHWDNGAKSNFITYKKKKGVGVFIPLANQFNIKNWRRCPWDNNPELRENCWEHWRLELQLHGDEGSGSQGVKSLVGLSNQGQVWQTGACLGGEKRSQKQERNPLWSAGTGAWTQKWAWASRRKLLLLYLCVLVNTLPHQEVCGC